MAELNSAPIVDISVATGELIAMTGAGVDDFARVPVAAVQAAVALAGTATQPGDLGSAAGLDTADIEAMITSQAPVMTPTGLTAVVDAGIAAGGATATLLADSAANIIGDSASGPAAVNLATRFETMSILERSDHLGAMLAGQSLEGPVNPGEMAYVDEAGKATGIWFYPETVSDQIAGLATAFPQDPASQRLIWEYDDCTSDIATNDLVVDFSTTLAKRFNFTADLDLGAKALPAGWIGRHVEGVVVASNTHATLARTITFVLSGTLLAQTLNTTVLAGATATTLSVPALKSVFIRYTMTSTGTLHLRVDAQAPAGVGVTDGDKGNITVSGGGLTWTIDNGVVTNAMLETVATATIKGRTTAATGAVENLTPTQVTAMLNIATTGLKGLLPVLGGGTTNFLRADGAWAAPPGGGATNLGYTAATRILTSDTGADVTLPLVTTTEAGLAPASGGGTATFLRADGAWAAPTAAGLVGLQQASFPASSFIPDATNPPSYTLAAGTNFRIESWDFSSTTAQTIYIPISAPKRWNKSTIQFRVRWFHPNTTTNFDVTFEGSAAAFADGDDLDALAFGAVQYSKDTGATGGLKKQFYSPLSAAITVAGAPGDEEFLMLRFRRDPAGGGVATDDDLAVDAKVLGIDIFWTNTTGVDS